MNISHDARLPSGPFVIEQRDLVAGVRRHMQRARFEPSTVTTFHRATPTDGKRDVHTEDAHTTSKSAKRKRSSPGTPKTKQSNAKTQRSRRKRTLSVADKKAVAALQRWRCVRCAQLLPARFEVDHRRQLADTGDEHYTNLQALCASCHAAKGEEDRKRKRPRVWGGFLQL